MPPDHMSPDPSTIRIGDAEREQSVVLLGGHTALGRLTLTEFESRVDVVYAARTQPELDAVLADLPVPEPKLGWRPAALPKQGSPAPAWTPWAVTGAICVLIWIVTSFAHGEPLAFWPFWVIGPWGVVLLARAGHTRRQ